MGPIRTIRYTQGIGTASEAYFKNGRQDPGHFRTVSSMYRRNAGVPTKPLHLLASSISVRMVQRRGIAMPRRFDTDDLQPRGTASVHRAPVSPPIDTGHRVPSWPAELNKAINPIASERRPRSPLSASTLVSPMNDQYFVTRHFGKAIPTATLAGTDIPDRRGRLLCGVRIYDTGVGHIRDASCIAAC